MVIDSKGRLFGKINIVDLIILIMLLIMLLIMILLVLNNYANEDISSPATDIIRVTFNVDDIPEIFSDSIQEGIPVRVQKSSVAFGKVTDASITDMIFYGVNAEGKWVASPKPNYKSATFIVEGNGKYSDGQALLGDAELYPGRYIAVVLDMTAFWAKVVEVEK